jgi:diguanylate cyclase (GGDEF)-like protein/putative nucleotidyltransferase with HDIG domain/PAS domain S-box-containing protein
MAPPPAPAIQISDVSPLASDPTLELASLLSKFDDPPSLVRDIPLRLSPRPENGLIQARLGVASGLFNALRWKHEPTAKHSLRVALACSNWATQLGMPQDQVDELEVAALLHDIGKLGIPDQILAKSSALSDQETAIMDGHWTIGAEILSGCCASQTLQDMVAYARARFDGSYRGLPLAGEHIPQAARMLAIVDAFDAMTTDQIYRPARSRERAFHELCRCAGSQFDPRLVRSFHELHECDELKLLELAPQRWLHALDPKAVNAAWQWNANSITSSTAGLPAIFPQRLLEHMEDAVLFVDAALRIVGWNPAAERLTGVPAESALHKLWSPSLLGLRDERGQPVTYVQCPLIYSVRTGTAWTRRLGMQTRRGRSVAVDAQALPVVNEQRITQGIALVLHDVSQEALLERRCVNLHERATRDPMTQVANRAEFDRLFEAFVASHADRQRACSLMIADIDRFKRINDTYGHQAGDEVIRGFASLLKGYCRPGDLVARYGGEEFVLLCADCDIATVAHRAEQIRAVFSRTPHKQLQGKSATASFGVTECQPGDTPETMFRRADRALLNAKEEGRNRVVQLGSGNDEPAKHTPRANRSKSSRDALVEQRFHCDAPLEASIDKLRGFIADHHATIVALDGNQVQLSVACPGNVSSQPGVQAETPNYILDLKYRERRVPREPSIDGEIKDDEAPSISHTTVDVSIRAEGTSNSGRRQLETAARKLLVSLRAYLMATDAADPLPPSIWLQAKAKLAALRARP